MNPETNSKKASAKRGCHAPVAVILHCLIFVLVLAASAFLGHKSWNEAHKPTSWFVELSWDAVRYFAVLAGLALLGIVALCVRRRWALLFVAALDFALPVTVLFPFFHSITEGVHLNEAIVLALIILCPVGFVVWLASSNASKEYFLKPADPRTEPEPTA